MRETFISPILVGRTQELEILDRALRAAQGGAGRVILLAGESGIGKSRLAAELGERAAAAQFLIWRGYCSEQDSSFPYAPWIDALRAFLVPRNAAEVNELLGASASELVKLLPELAALMPSIQPTLPLEPAAERHRLFETFARLAVWLVASRPLLIILEDLHWSDELSIELLLFFIRRIATLPVLILGTYRSEDLPSRLASRLMELTRERNVDEIQLGPLARLEVGRMAQQILKEERPISSGWLDFLMPLTEGNPFLVEEMTRSLALAGARPDNWDQLQIPRGIQRTIQSRVEGLPEGTRHIMSLASVIGERFDFALLQEISAVDEQTLLRSLKEMISAQLVVELLADQFSFRHAITRQVVYATLMLRERRAMHRTIGEALERAAALQADAPAAPLAYHFYQAGEWQEAAIYSQRAGEKAQALYAPREAVIHYSHALEAARQLGIPAPRLALRGRAQAYEILGDFDRARADNEAALELASGGSNLVDVWQSLIDLGFLWQSRDLERAGEYYQRGLDLARKIGDSSVMAQTLNRVGNWQMNQGRANEALADHREAFALFQEHGDRHGMAQTLDLLGIVSYQLGEIIQGAGYLAQAVPILRELDDRQGLVNTLSNLTLRALGDTEVIGEINYLNLTNLSDEALQIARGFNWYQGEAVALMQGAICLMQAGMYGQALERLAEAQSIIDESQNRESFARIQLIFGQTFIGLMALSEAKQHLEKALAYLQELGSGLLILAAKVHLAMVAIMQGDIAGARGLLAGLLPTEYPEAQEKFALRRCWSVCAELELAQGNPGRALIIVERLLATAPDMTQYGPHAVPRLSHLRSQALTALGRLEDAEAELQGALPVALKHGQRPMAWRLHAQLGNVYRAMGRRADAEREFAAARAIIHDLAKGLPEGPLHDNYLKQALAMIPAEPVLTSRQAAKKVSGGLTERERQVATLIAQGKSNREIARELVISEKTTERHVANILSKLGFNARTQIAAWVAGNRSSR